MISKPTTRRRPVEKIIGLGGSGLPAAADIQNNVVLSDARTPKIQRTNSGRDQEFEFKIPRWLSVVWILFKILGTVSIIIAMIRAPLGFFHGFVRSEDNFLVKFRAMEGQINEVRQKFEDGISLVRKEFDERMEIKRDEVNMKLKAFKVRSDVFEKFMDGLETRGFLSKEEFGDFYEDFIKAKKNYDTSDISERDYALGGGKVLRHSGPYGPDGEAEKMIRPSFGEPGKCFPLKGDSGFVEIRLRAAILPVAVTLEYVAKNVAYDRFDAPKHCRVYGWMQGQVSTDDMEIDMSKFLLTEFTYDLEKSNAQTFMVEAAAYCLVDTIRLDFTSNHGNASHTCIYRLRVHGREPV